MTYLITNDEGLFWSSGTGWADVASADTYTDEDRHQLHLPIGGRWVALGKA